VERPVAEIMSSIDKTVEVLNSLANKSRLQILDCIRDGARNPGEMAKKLGRHRSTVEKHLRVLLKSGIIEKVPSLTISGQLSVNYKIRDSVSGTLSMILEKCASL